MALEKLIPATYKDEIISSESVSQLLGYSSRWLYTKLLRKSNWLDGLNALGFSGEFIEISIARKNGRGGSRVKTLSDKDFQALLGYEACLGNTHAAQVITGNKVTGRVKRLKKSDERKIQLNLAKKLEGQIEVSTVFGNIDILTSAEIIEVKHWNSWKCALGQVIAYGHFYPKHRKRIHCYGKLPGKPSSVKDFLDEHNVRLTWEV